MSDKETAIQMLRTLAEKIASESRYPKRADFSDEDVAFIKAQLGPWPRALEAAGLKPPRDEEAHRAKQKEKHIRAKIRRRCAKQDALSKK